MARIIELRDQLCPIKFHPLLSGLYLNLHHVGIASAMLLKTWDSAHLEECAHCCRSRRRGQHKEW